jgi:two-component system chemotaxis response regulator CheB
MTQHQRQGGWKTDRTGSPRSPIRVLVVDDSGVMRRAITRILESEPDLQVVGTAKDGAEAVELAVRLRPDVITMDVNMPRVDGLRAVQIIMGRQPIPIVIVSGYAQAGGVVQERALAYGAVHVVEKPTGSSISLDIDACAQEIREKVRAAARVPVVRSASFVARLDPKPAPRPERTILPHVPRVAPANGLPVVAIGASTGGTVALGELIPALPAEFAGCLVIVQHMAPGYTAELARALDETARIRVVEAKHGDLLRAGVAFIAPGGHHMEVREERIRLNAGPTVKMHRPSVDVLFDSLRPVAKRVRAVLLSGMGDDGVAGMTRLLAAGAQTIVQNEMSSVVWGMPGAAIKAGCATLQMSPSEIGEHLGREVVASLAQSLVTPPPVAVSRRRRADMRCNGLA